MTPILCRSARFWLFVVLGCLAVGCSTKDSWEANRPAVVPAQGQVVYQGKPLADAAVTFMNADAKVSGYGRTGADGRFRLTTFKPNDGVVPGKQQVSIRRAQVIDRSKPGFDYSASSEVPPAPEERWLIPKRYGQFDTSGLTVEVQQGARNDFTLDLKD